MTEEQPKEITIEDLELSLQVYEIEGEDKLKKLQELFKEKKVVDLSKMFYEEKSNLEIKFQNIVSDLIEFLVNQQIGSTDKLRKTFYRILQNPLNFLFKVSRFEIFNLRLNAFDIELQPIDAISDLGSSILVNIQKHQKILVNLTSRYSGGQYKSYDQFLEDAQSRLIQDLIFTFYSYMRKGGGIIKKKFQDKVRVVQLYNKIQERLIKRSIEVGDIRTLKELSILNYELYLLENSYDVLCFYLKVPFKAPFAEVFRELETLGLKAKQNSNYDIFILIFIRYAKEVLGKLDHEGIDPVFSSYIENVLTSLLELWGCRLCYYQEFYDLFCKLFSLHPNKAAAMHICLKYNPQMKKDDIVLLRVNFKHELQQKQSQLLSLLKSKSMQEINNSLSALYHQILYNLDFKDYSRDQLVELVTLLNGNPSVGEFFTITEKAFKEWNHSIDLINPHKFIEGEFKYPALDETKILQSLRLLNNLCVLQGKSEKDYEKLVKAGSIQKIFLGFGSFLFSNEKTKQLVASNQLVKILLVNILQFLRRTIISGADWEPTALLFSSNLSQVSQPYVSELIATLKEIVTDNFYTFGIKNLVAIFKNIVAVQSKLKLPSGVATFDCIISNFMKGTQKQNEEIKLFRFFDSKISQHTKVTKSEETFLKQYACLNGDIIEPKNMGCFSLSELQIITNPVQFDKVMDNYYFTLDKNAKSFVQYLTIDWAQSTQQALGANLAIIKQLINKYPIVIPLLCSTRITSNNLSNRFIEFLVKDITAESFPLVKHIIECKCIKYKNGRDYVRQEIIPIILKETIKRINEGTDRVEHFQLLALSLTYSRPADIKIDLLQNSIEAIKYEMIQTKCENRVYRLSNTHYQVVRKFFQKKEVEMRKNGLTSIFEQQFWNQIRIKLLTLQNQGRRKSNKKTVISEQIMITPYTTPQQFDAEAIKMQKVTALQAKQSENPEVEVATLQASLPNKGPNTNLFTEKKAQSFTTVDLTKLKYNIESRLGPELKPFCRKEGFKLITASTIGVDQSESNEQSITLVQYYLKEFQIPQITGEVVLKYLYSLLTEQVAYCSIFSNLANLQKLFSSLILLLGYYSKSTTAQTGQGIIPEQLLSVNSGQNAIIDQLLSINLGDKNKTVKIIFKVFSAIGYTNLWAESYNSLKNTDYLKDLRTKCEFKEEEAEESFFSWVLRISLENEGVKAQLNEVLGSIFKSRPKEQNALMYRVTLNRGLLNLIMKSLQIQNLSYVSLLFHSNFNNLRLYTDQLHQGLKALNMASKNRAYNQYVQLSKDLDDEEFYTPIKLFKENFSFFIRIEKEGYNFKRGQEEKLGRERVIKVLRSGVTGEQLNTQIEQVIEQFEVELEKLQSNIASRVKAFYLATKLRDLSNQNSLTICLLYQILSEAKQSGQIILNRIKQIQIFSLMTRLYNGLVRFDVSPECENFLLLDRSTIEKEMNICSIKRYSHSMSKVYQKCELQLDEVIQRCIDSLKYFFATKLGKDWLSTLQLYPPFLVKSFIDTQASEKLIKRIKENVSKAEVEFAAIEIACADTNSFTNLVKGIRELKKGQLLAKDKVKIKLGGQSYSLSQFLKPLEEHLISSETFCKSKDGFLLFNKYKTSQKTLQEIQLLGLVVGYCIYHNIQMDLPLHSSLLAVIGFGVCDLQDLLDVDFKVWQDLRNVMSVGESKDLNLTFSYVFESLETLKSERIDLIDKGTSKKVNNLNREEYCDLVCCYLLYKIVSKQINRFLESICYLSPKELLSSLKIASLHPFFIKKYPQYSEQILRQYMRKRGLVQPDTVLSKKKRIQNLKDYQTIQWLCEIVEQNSQIKSKIWKNEENIFVCTWMGQGIEYDAETKMLLVGRLKSKDELKQVLAGLK